jgi:hypothetical protein
VCVLRLPNLPLAAAARAESDVLFCCVCACRCPSSHKKPLQRSQIVSVASFDPATAQTGYGRRWLQAPPLPWRGASVLWWWVLCAALHNLHDSLTKKWTFSFWTSSGDIPSCDGNFPPFLARLCMQIFHPHPALITAWKLKLISYSFRVLSQLFSRAKNKSLDILLVSFPLPTKHSGLHSVFHPVTWQLETYSSPPDSTPLAAHDFYLYSMIYECTQRESSKESGAGCMHTVPSHNMSYSHCFLF